MHIGIEESTCGPEARLVYGQTPRLHFVPLGVTNRRQFVGPTSGGLHTNSIARGGRCAVHTLQDYNTTTLSFRLKRSTVEESGRESGARQVSGQMLRLRSA